jgi:hypothetical protein
MLHGRVSACNTREMHKLPMIKAIRARNKNALVRKHEKKISLHPNGLLDCKKTLKHNSYFLNEILSILCTSLDSFSFAADMKIVPKLLYCNIFTCTSILIHRGNVTVGLVYIWRVALLVYYCLIRWRVFEETAEVRFELQAKHEYTLHCITLALVKQSTGCNPNRNIPSKFINKIS